MNTNDPKRRFKMFQGAPNRLGWGGPRVTLNPRGVLLINAKGYEALGSPEAVELGYDEENSTIGLVPSNPQRKNAFPVKGNALDKYPYYLVHAAPFCNLHDLRPGRTLRFTHVRIEDGMMLLDIETAVPIGVKRKPRS
jgi:hypothetical protein